MAMVMIPLQPSLKYKEKTGSKQDIGALIDMLIKALPIKSATVNELKGYD